MFSPWLPAGADEVYLANGDRVSGTVISKTGDTLTMKTDFAGEIVIAWDKVISVSTSAPVVVKLDDATMLTGTRSLNGGVQGEQSKYPPAKP